MLGAGLKAAFNFLLYDAQLDITVVKNRFESPALGYSDVLVNVVVSEHICEIQLHLAAVYDVKGEGGPCC